MCENQTVHSVAFSTKTYTASSSHLACHWAATHLLCNIVNVLEWHVSVVCNCSIDNKSTFNVSINNLHYTMTSDAGYPDTLTLTSCVRMRWNPPDGTVLNFLAVSWGFLECFDDHGSCGRHNRDSGLAVLDGELDCDFQTLPVFSSLGNIITDLLRWQTKRSNLWGQCGCRTYFTSDCPKAHVLDGRRVKLGRHDGVWIPEDSLRMQIRK